MGRPKPHAANPKPPGLGATPEQLEAAWKDRLQDAMVLHDSGRYSISVVSAFYALEILLKAAICRLIDVEELPKPVQTHDLDLLLTFSGLRRRLNGEPMTKERWDKIASYRSRIDQLRYGQEVARREDSARFHRALHADPNKGWAESTYGVIPWIMRHRQS